MAKRAKTAIVQLKVRIREPVRAHLEKAAAGRGVSLNYEIADRLERSMDRLSLLEEVMTLRFGKPLGRILIRLGEDPALLKRALANLSPEEIAGGEILPPTDEEFDAMLELHGVKKGKKRSVPAP